MNSIARLVVASAAVASIACSSEIPVAPRASTGAVMDVGPLARGAAGQYNLSFFLSGPELILLAHVFDPLLGDPAYGGALTFQICLDRGGPTLQMQPLPSAECERGGSGAWVNLARLSMDVGCPTYPAGYVCVDFGIAPQFTTAGFRFRYTSQGSNVANGSSDPVDYVP